MIVVTHEMSFAREVADRVVFMDAGVVVEHGIPSQVLGNPREERARTFLARVVRRDETLRPTTDPECRGAGTYGSGPSGSSLCLGLRLPSRWMTRKS